MYYRYMGNFRMGSSRKSGKLVVSGSDIVCQVQAVLEDLILVSYQANNNKVFQGVLLDSTRRNIPHGISPPGGFAQKLLEDNPRHAATDLLALQPPDISESFPALSRRHTYYQEDRVEKGPLVMPSRKGNRPFLAQDRLGVRLRARQVLCSKCSSVCNEKGENVKEKAKKEHAGRIQGRKEPGKLLRQRSAGLKSIWDMSSQAASSRTSHLPQRDIQHATAAKERLLEKTTELPVFTARSQEGLNKNKENNLMEAVVCLDRIRTPPSQMPDQNVAKKSKMKKREMMTEAASEHPSGGKAESESFNETSKVREAKMEPAELQEGRSKKRRVTIAPLKCREAAAEQQLKEANSKYLARRFSLVPKLRRLDTSQLPDARTNISLPKRAPLSLKISKLSSTGSSMTSSPSSPDNQKEVLAQPQNHAAVDPLQVPKIMETAKWVTGEPIRISVPALMASSLASDYATNSVAALEATGGQKKLSCSAVGLSTAVSHHPRAFCQSSSSPAESSTPVTDMLSIGEVAPVGNSALGGPCLSTSTAVPSCSDHVTSSSSSHSSTSDRSNQPLKIRFSTVVKPCGRSAAAAMHYSIVKQEAASSQEEEKTSDSSPHVETGVTKEEARPLRLRRKRSGEDKKEEEEIAPLNKVPRLKVEPLQVVADSQEMAAPVLKISLAKQSAVLKVSAVGRVRSIPGVKVAPVPKLAAVTATQHVLKVAPILPPPHSEAAPHAGAESVGVKFTLSRPPKVKITTASLRSRAARKALKRARREAHRRSVSSSPAAWPHNSSPAYNRVFSPSASPAHPPLPSPARSVNVASPARGYGGLSPGRPFSLLSPVYSGRFHSPVNRLSCPSPAYTLLCPTSQKIIIRKNKKKKHKKNRKEGEEETPAEETPLSSNTKPTKFVISLRGISRAVNGSGPNNKATKPDKTEATPSQDEFRLPEEEDDDEVLSRPGLKVETAQLTDGHTICVGDVVWARPPHQTSWPAKVLNLMMVDERNGEKVAHAQVSWYKARRSSVLPCHRLRPFLEEFEAEYQEGRKGDYGEAVRLATEDARQASTVPLLGLSPIRLATPGHSPFHLTLGAPGSSPCHLALGSSPLHAYCSPAQSPRLTGRSPAQ